jgi:DNA replication protein DnaC
MLNPITLERLRSMKLPGFIDALMDQGRDKLSNDLSFDDRFTLLIDREHTRRLNQRIQRLVYAARLSCQASIDTVDFSVSRGVSKKQLSELAQGDWVQNGTNLIITGPTGIGKTFIASAIALSLCQKGVPVKFQRTNQWLSDFASSNEKRRFLQSLTGYRKLPLLVFDEWMRDPMSISDTRFMLDLIDDRQGRASCLFVSQVPIADWHPRFSDPTTAEALLDRLVHSSIRIELSGDSMRKLRAKGGNVASLRES